VTSTGNTKTINIGLNGAAGSTTTTRIGSVNGTSTITLNGNVGLGIAGQSPYNFIISKNITGGTTAWGFISQGIVQSDVTSQAILNGTGAFTQATTFTLSNLYHYNTAQGAFGAGSTVTNQYGFFGSSSLIGATNNYGFYGAIAAGTGRWNTYMVGTAANYFAGGVSIGTATDAGAGNLFVTGVVKSTVYTVATLPSASASGSGARAFVSNALAPIFGATVVTGGAVAVPVYSDGTNWKVG
jgi:hypothetical protein